MQRASRQRFVELLRREPTVIVSRERAVELARQAEYDEWPGAEPAALPSEDRPRMTIVTSADSLPHDDKSIQNGCLRHEPPSPGGRPDSGASV